MRQAVVDASVAAKWVVEEEHSAKAALLLGFDACHAPDHWLAEAGNVLWSKFFHGDLTAVDLEERMAVLLRAPVIGTPIASLMPRALAISVACVVTIYDSLYVALAEQRYARSSLPTGARITGPAIVTEDETSTLVGPGWSATVNTPGYIEMVRLT